MIKWTPAFLQRLCSAVGLNAGLVPPDTTVAPAQDSYVSDVVTSQARRLVESTIVSLPQIWKLERSQFNDRAVSDLSASLISDLPQSAEVVDELVDLAFDANADPIRRRHAQFVLIYQQYFSPLAADLLEEYAVTSFKRAHDMLRNDISLEHLIDSGSQRQEGEVSRLLHIMTTETVMSPRWFAARIIIPIAQSQHEYACIDALAEAMTYIRVGVLAMSGGRGTSDHLYEAIDSIAATYRELFVLAAWNGELVDMEIEGLIDMIEAGEYIHTLFALKSLKDFLVFRMFEDPAATEEAGKRLVRIGYFDDDVEDFRYTAALLTLKDVLDSFSESERLEMGFAWRFASEVIKKFDPQGS